MTREKDGSDELSKAIDAVRQYQGRKTVKNVMSLLEQRKLWPDDFIEDAKKQFARKVLRSMDLVNVEDTDENEKKIRVYAEPSTLDAKQLERLIAYHTNLAKHHQSQADKYKALLDQKKGQALLDQPTLPFEEKKEPAD